jgi:hypothetical protein
MQIVESLIKIGRYINLKLIFRPSSTSKIAIGGGGGLPSL